MLVVTQKDGDVVEIGDGIRIMVCQTRRGAVRLAIEAPREIEIRRVPRPDPDPGPEDGVALVSGHEARVVRLVAPSAASVTTRRVRPGKR